MPLVKLSTLFDWNKYIKFNLVPRVFLRHTLITKPNEHPGTLWKPLWISWFLGNTNQRKMAVALALNSAEDKLRN